MALSKLELDSVAARARQLLADAQGTKVDLGNSPRRLLDGTQIPLGDPRGTSKAHGMSSTVIHSRGEDGYRLGRLLQALVRNDKSLAPLEIATSEKFAVVGSQPSTPGRGVIVPFGDLWRTPGQEDAVDALHEEVKQMMPFAPADVDEMQWLRHRLGVKAMDPLDDSAGGSLIPLPAQGPLVQFLRPSPVVQQAGCRVTPLPAQGSVYLPKSMGDPTLTWLAENQPITASTASTGSVSLIAKRAAGLVVYPADLQRYSANAVETLVRESLLARANLTLDLAALEGSGGTGVPLGIVNYPRSANDAPEVNKITLHLSKGAATNGDVFDPDDTLRMLALIEEANDPAGGTAWAMRPLMFSGLSSLRADQGGGPGTGAFMFPFTRGDMGQGVRKELLGLPVVCSTQISKSRTKGAGSGLTYIIAANWGALTLGLVGGMELMMSQDAFFANDQLALRVILRGDSALTTPQSVVICDQLTIPT